MAQGGSPSFRVAYSVALDATKVVRVAGMCTSFNPIIEGVFPQHYISLYERIYYEINKMIYELKKD